MKQDAHFLSNREIRRIAKENKRTVRALEAKKKRKNVDPSEYLSQMKDPGNVLEIDNLHTYFFTDVGVSKAVNGVSFSIPENATVGVVGESGCGKSVTSLSVMQLVQAPQGQIVEGEIRFRATDGTVYDIAKMPTAELRRLRGSEISMIFQEPMTSLNPVFTIGYQLDEVTLLHEPGATREEAKKRTYEMLSLVGIIPENVYDRYPHELSGGMRQRVMIAMALICNPRLIIADEPTTALDVTIQAQILDLLRDVRKKINGSIMLITHDLGVIAEMADYVVVMYAGKVIETGTVEEIFENPCHPYTIGLQKSKPVINQSHDRLYSIPGQVPNPVNMPTYCYFRDRCNRACETCNGVYPGYVQVSPTHLVACYRAEEISAENAAKNAVAEVEPEEPKQQEPTAGLFESLTGAVGAVANVTRKALVQAGKLTAKGAGAAVVLAANAIDGAEKAAQTVGNGVSKLTKVVDNVGKKMDKPKNAPVAEPKKAVKPSGKPAEEPVRSVEETAAKKESLGDKILFAECFALSFAQGLKKPTKKEGERNGQDKTDR